MRYMNKIIQSKLLYSNDIEDVIDYNGRFYIVNKKQNIYVIPYTLDKGMLDKIGIINSTNLIYSNLEYSLINGIINIDDETDLVTANRLLFDLTNVNVSNANNWMYLGKIKTSLIDNIGSSLYCVNITNLNLSIPTKLDKANKEIQFKLVNSNDIIATDNCLLLASYLRLFQFFYINSLNK